MKAGRWINIPKDEIRFLSRTAIALADARSRDIRLIDRLLNDNPKRTQRLKQSLIHAAATQPADGTGFRRRMDRWLDLNGR